MDERCIRKKNRGDYLKSTRVVLGACCPRCSTGLNTAHPVFYGILPFYLMYGRDQCSTFSTVASQSMRQWRLGVLDEQKLLQHVSDLLVTQEELHRRLAADVSGSRSRHRLAESSGEMPNFNVADSGLLARAHHPRTTPILTAAWTGHLYSRQHRESSSV